MVAVDVTNRKLLLLPGDLAGYRVPGSGRQIDPNGFPISRAARMSMAIPYFFEPVELEDGNGKIATIVDGGTLAGAGAHSYSEGDATGGSEEAARFKSG